MDEQLAVLRPKQSGEKSTCTAEAQSRVTSMSSGRRSSVCAVLIVLFVSVVSVIAAPNASAEVPQAVVGMPFAGKWAYSNPTTASCGPNASQTSHPSCHEVYFGDWATDVYQAAGVEVRLQVPYATGLLSFSWDTSATGSCGETRRVRVYVSGIQVGQVHFTHLSNATLTTTSPTNGMVVGKIASLSCNPGGTGKHVHVEFKNIGNRACFVNHSTASTSAGMSVEEGTPIGVLGSENTGIRQVCASVPGGGEAPNNDAPLTSNSSSMVASGAALHVFARGVDHEMYDKAWNGTGWNGLQRIQAGAVFKAGPTAVRYAGEVHLLGRGMDDEFYKNTLTSVGWTGFVRLESGAVFAGGPVAVVRGSYLHIFGRGVDKQLYDKVWTGSGWNSVQSVVPGALFESDPTVVSAADGLHVFGRGTDDELYESVLLPTGWTGFQRLQPGSLFVGDPVAVQYASELHLVACGRDGELYKNTRTSVGWTGFSRLEPGALFTSNPSVTVINNALHIIARGTDGELYDKAWNGSAWNGLQRIAPGSVFENDPTVTAYASELHLVARGVDHQLYKNTLTGTGWTGFSSLQPGSVFEGR
jgi:hypothetical protein